MPAAASPRSRNALPRARTSRSPGCVFIATGEPARRRDGGADRAPPRRTAWHGWHDDRGAAARLAEAILSAGAADCVVVDCLTLWTSNALAAYGAQETEAHAVAAAAAASLRRSGLTIAVTNEVGLGIVPDNALARSYRDLLGRVNAIWAEAAGQVLFFSAGRASRLARPRRAVLEELSQVSDPATVRAPRRVSAA